MPTPQRVALKGYKVHKEMSEETTAYTTKITLDGKEIGDARNDGRGGCDRVYIEPEAREQWNGIVREFATARGCEFEPDAALIADLAKIQEERKVAARLMKRDPRITCVVAVDDGKQTVGSLIYYTATRFHAYATITPDRIDANIAEQYDGNPFRKYTRDEV
jgi:hypothetical protein